MDASSAEQDGNRGNGLERSPFALEELGGDRNVVLHCPFPQLDRVHEQTLVRPVHGKTAIADPSPGRGLAHPQVDDRLGEAQAHEELDSSHAAIRRGA